MRRVTYKSVLQRVSQMYSGKTNPDVSDAATINAFINKRYRNAWEFYFWPELMAVERRQYRADWLSVTTYAASTATSAVEVFHVPSLKYVQALQTSLNQPPFTFSGGDWVENSAYWAECKSSYSGEDWATGLVLAVGDQVRNPDDDRFYQCHTAHTAGATFDTTKFGILTPFIRNLSLEQTGETPIGEIEFASTYDPRVTRRGNNCLHPFDLLGNDAIFKDAAPDRPYVRFRTRPVSFTGAAFDVFTAYGVGDQFYFTDGDYYQVLTASAAGETPVTNPDKFSRLEFPYIFAEAIAQAAYVDILGKTDGQLEKWPMGDGEANTLLIREIDKIERQQRQSTQIPLTVY